MSTFQEDFKRELEETFGEWDKNGARFGSYSYGDIADKLCMSGSQFSKLLYGSATNGMYERSIKNIQQLQSFENLKLDNNRLIEELDTIKKRNIDIGKTHSIKYTYVILISLLCLILGYALKMLLTKDIKEKLEDSSNSTHALASYFDREFTDEHVSPFLSIDDAQNYCPGSAFEGIWNLEKPYVIPIPLKKPGLYYFAKGSDVRMKCLKNVELDQKGKVLLGFENMIHELWIDTKREPLTPKYFNVTAKNYTKEFYNIDFENDASFKKIATIRSFFFNTFEIKQDKIIRKGEPSGRFAEKIDHDLVKQYEIDIKYVLQEVIGNMIKTKCEKAINNYCNPNTLVENESTIKFDCDFTINNENLGLGGSYPYSKSYKLIKQNYSDNLLCKCK